LDAKLEGNSVAIIELEQAGIFRVEGGEDKAIEPVLAVACPKMLFPYVREAIDGMMTRGTMPPFMLAPVNFDALFAQALQQQQSAESGELLN
jgi:preprotein translocase subunit SecB